MIRWCAYCQRYQNEVDPFDDYSITHTICKQCTARRAYLAVQPTSLGDIRDFFVRVSGIHACPRPTAEAIVSEGAALGLDPVDLLLGIVQPLLRQIGDRWARGEATTSDERRVSALCTSVIRLIVESDTEAAALRRAQPSDVMLALAEGNAHLLGVKLLEVFLLKNGVSTFIMGPGATSADIVKPARGLRPRIVAISAAVPEHISSAQCVAESLADGPPDERPLVVVGGLAILCSRASTPVMLPPASDDRALIVCRDLSQLRDLAVQSREAPGARC